MEIIINNPYRLLGVYSTSSRHEIVANQGRMNAFLRVGQTITFPLDLVGILPAVSRSNHNVADAISRLTLPKDQLKYAQFWFAKKSPLDEIACGKLINGDIDGAMEIWRKRDSASSLQNLIVSSLIKKQFGEAIKNAQKLYTSFGNEFVKMVLGDNALATSDNLAHDFLDALCEEINPKQFLNEITIPEWKQYVGTRSTQPLIDSILAAIELSKSSKGNGSKARYNAGTKLMNDTKMVLQQLKQFVSTSELQYQMIADKLGLEILQCGIDYYNDSDEAEAAYKAMKLQKYAQSIVVGQMAKDRCDENVHILENIISKLPPKEVMAENKAILSCLATFSMQPNLIKYSIQLIKDCAPHIVAIKEKLGITHKYYLDISTTIVNNALGNIIDEVNEAQQGDFENLKTTLIAAWRTQLYMDKFDLEPKYEQGRYKDSREALYGIIENCKGFESSFYSSMYRYGCGWCNDLDVSDVDLRTDDEFYRSCRDMSSYREYIQKYPSGKYVPEARKKIEKLTREENERKAKKERLDKAISACTSISEVIAMYQKEKGNGIDADKCSLRAYELAEDESDYRKVMSTFGFRSSGGKKSNAKIHEIEREREENAEKRRKALKWGLWVGGALLVLLGIYFFWGIRGFAVGCTGIAIISGLIAWGIMQSKDANGCGLFFACAAIAAIFGFSAVGLHDWADSIEDEANSKELYAKIMEEPTIKDCADYIQQYSKTKNANKVREIWLNSLLKESQAFDYDSYQVNISIDEETITPVQKIRDFINKNEKFDYASKGRSALESICDSLYNVADNKSTVSGWRQYQAIVPTDYFKDSDDKIEEIENQAWNTESMAWQHALSENSISAFNKYKSLYPNGAHIGICEKKLIDLEVADVYAGEHGSLPAMDRIGGGGGYTTTINISNSTAYTLTLLYSGPDSKRLEIPAGGKSSLRLKNGNYRVAASVSDTSVRNFAGNEDLQGGSYSVDYYISSYRY